MGDGSRGLDERAAGRPDEKARRDHEMTERARRDDEPDEMTSPRFRV
jgi:hypothetical protein